MQKLLADVERLAYQAGQRLLEEFYRPGGPRGHGQHADIDTEIEESLSLELRLLLPGSSVLGEELGQTGDPDTEYCWLIDPHDGTAAFLRGFRGSSVSIGLLKHGQPVLGVVYAPLYPNDSGDLICGGPGLGLRRNGLEWRAAPSPKPLGPADIVVVSQDADQRTDANIQALAPARYLAMPSIAYRLALAAVGDARAGQSLVHLSAHDVGAGHALLLAAGKVLEPWEDRKLTYTPRLDPMLLIGGDSVAVDELRSRKRGAVLHYARSSAPLSPLPGGRRWREAGLSLERAQGCLLGQLAGDSLGSLVEFKTSVTIAQLYPTGPEELADGGVWRSLAGQPTDDSEMALALARQLVSDGGFRPERVLQAYRDWHASEPFDIGSTTSQALRGSVNSDSQANGSLMRCSPLGIAFSTQALLEIAPADSALTHPNPVCLEACRIFTQTISRAMEGMGASEAIALALAESNGDVHAMLEASLASPPEEFQHQMGWVRIAFCNAFHWLGQERPLAEALTWTVRQGGDTDTNAAIAGALLGAFQGLRAIPAQWRLSVQTCRPHPSNPSAKQVRPRAYWPLDALNLAELLLELRTAG